MARNRSQSPRRWAGAALLFIASVHTLFGVFAGLRLLPDPQLDRLAGDRVPLLEMTPGFGSQPGVDALTLTIFWFLFFGFALFPLGFLVRHMERSGQTIPKSLGFQLLALGVSGGFFLPASGFWTVLVPAWNILRRPTAPSRL